MRFSAHPGQGAALRRTRLWQAKQCGPRRMFAAIFFCCPQETQRRSRRGKQFRQTLFPSMRPTVVTIFPHLSQVNVGTPSGPQRWQTRCPSCSSPSLPSRPATASTPPSSRPTLRFATSSCGPDFTAKTPAATTNLLRCSPKRLTEATAECSGPVAVAVGNPEAADHSGLPDRRTGWRPEHCLGVCPTSSDQTEFVGRARDRCHRLRRRSRCRSVTCAGSGQSAPSSVVVARHRPDVPWTSIRGQGPSSFYMEMPSGSNPGALRVSEQPRSG